MVLPSQCRHKNSLTSPPFNCIHLAAAQSVLTYVFPVNMYLFLLQTSNFANFHVKYPATVHKCSILKCTEPFLWVACPTCGHISLMVAACALVWTRTRRARYAHSSMLYAVAFMLTPDSEVKQRYPLHTYCWVHGIPCCALPSWYVTAGLLCTWCIAKPTAYSAKLPPEKPAMADFFR